MSDLGVDAQLAQMIPPNLARQHSCVPVMADGQQLLMASPSPLIPDVEEELRLRMEMPVRTVLCTPAQINEAIAQFFPRDAPEMVPVKKAKKAKKAEPAKAAGPAGQKPAGEPLSAEEFAKRRLLGTIMGFNIGVVLAVGAQYLAAGVAPVAAVRVIAVGCGGRPVVGGITLACCPNAERLARTPCRGTNRLVFPRRRSEMRKGYLHIRGGRPLEGTVEASGSKNAALPIMAASSGRFRGAAPPRPRLADVGNLVAVPGAWEWTSAARGTRSRRASRHAPFQAGYTHVRRMRASFAFSAPCLPVAAASSRCRADAGSARGRSISISRDSPPWERTSRSATATSSPDPHGSAGRRSTWPAPPDRPSPGPPT